MIFYETINPKVSGTVKVRQILEIVICSAEEQKTLILFSCYASETQITFIEFQVATLKYKLP